MRTVLLTAAVFGLSAAGACACPAHDAHAGVDPKLTVASVTDDAAPTSTPGMVADEDEVAERITAPAEELE